MKKNDLVEVAKLGRSVGIRGELKLHITSDFENQFKPSSKYYLSTDKSLTIEHFNKTKSIIKFETINTLEDAKKLTNKILYSTIEDTKQNCTLKNGQYFWFDLVGLEVYENEHLLGTIEEIQRLPSCDYFFVNTNKQLVEKNLPKSFLIPYLNSYILNVDIDNKTIETKNTFQILENS